MGPVTWATPAVINTLNIFGGLPAKLSQWVKAPEYQAAIVAEKIIQPYKTDQKERVREIALNALTITSWALHNETIIHVV